MRARHWLVLGLIFSAAAGAVTYTPPPLGRLVFNEIIDPGTAAEAAYPLRLPKTGRYYAELILEPPAGAREAALSAPLAVDLAFAFHRHRRLLHQRSVHVIFEPGERSKTLFWVESPHILPDRSQLRMTTAVAAAPREQLERVNLRLQITRKIEFPSIIPR